MVMLKNLLETNGQFIIEKIMMFGSFIEDCIKSFHPDAVELTVTIIDILTQIIETKPGFRAVLQALTKQRAHENLDERFSVFV